MTIKEHLAAIKKEYIDLSLLCKAYRDAYDALEHLNDMMETSQHWKMVESAENVFYDARIRLEKTLAKVRPKP